MAPSRPIFFATPARWRRWLAANHATATELVVGFYRKSSGRPSITWPQSVDEALCYGWIDGIRRTIDGESYSIRFSPRRPGSIWSALNTRRAAELEAEGRMAPAGLAAWKRRKEAKTAIHAYQQRESARLPPALLRRFKRNHAAWRFFSSQPPGYRRLAAWYVISARKDETRERRLARLIEASSRGRRL